MSLKYSQEGVLVLDIFAFSPECYMALELYEGTNYDKLARTRLGHLQQYGLMS